MKILEQTFDKIKSINKKRRGFFTILIQGLIGVEGKRTFRNLARYMQIIEHTFSRQMTKSFDFAGLNTEMIKTSKNEGRCTNSCSEYKFYSKVRKADSWY